MFRIQHIWILATVAVAASGVKSPGLDILADIDSNGLVLLQSRALDKTASVEEFILNQSHVLNDDGPTSAESIYYRVNCPTATKKMNKKWFSGNMVMLGKNGLWCPNAKVGTSTVYRALTNIPGWIPLHKGKPTRCYPTSNQSLTAPCWYHNEHREPLMRSVTQMIKHGKGHELCDAFTFTFVRNPWDRLRSAYLEKIASGKFMLSGKLQPTFAEFVRFVASQDPKTMNMHWRPVSHTCLTEGANDVKAHYDKIYKLEDGLNEQLFEALSHTNLNFPKVEEAFMSRPPSLEDRMGNYTHAEHLSDHMELVKLVESAFADDIKVGGYKFESYP